VTVTTETRPFSVLQCDGIFDSEKKGDSIFPVFGVRGSSSGSIDERQAPGLLQESIDTATFTCSSKTERNFLLREPNICATEIQSNSLDSLPDASVVSGQDLIDPNRTFRLTTHPRAPPHLVTY